MRPALRRSGLALAGAVLASVPARAHEPVFGIGPETIYRGGVGVELELERDDLRDEEEWVAELELLYGATADLSLTLEVPTLLDRSPAAAETRGLGDVLLRGKYRFWRSDRLGSSRKASILFGVKAPTGRHHGRRRLGTGTVDFLAGLTAAYESRRWYAFGTVRGLLRTSHGGFEPGDRIALELAGGIRPRLSGYREPDLVVLLEGNGVAEGTARRNGRRLRNTGGFVGWLGPTALLSHRNWMLKLGLQIPVASSLHGGRDRPRHRSIAAVEYHF